MEAAKLPETDTASSSTASTTAPNSAALAGTFYGPVYISSGQLGLAAEDSENSSFPRAPNVSDGTPGLTGDPLSDAGPGLGVHAIVEFFRGDVDSDRLIFAFGNPGQSRLACYLTKPGYFTMKLTGECKTTFELDATTDRKGVTYGHLLFLSAEVGLFDNCTALRISVNGETVAIRQLPFALDFDYKGLCSASAIGSMKSESYSGNDLNSPTMNVARVLVYQNWFSAEQISEIAKWARVNWKV